MDYEQFANANGGYDSADQNAGRHNQLAPADQTYVSVTPPHVPIPARGRDVKGFKPSQNGLKYSNSWPPVPYINIPTPWGNIPVGSASNGMCGGMVYAVRDLFEAELLPPTDPTNPKPYSPAFNFLYARLVQSFDLPVGVVTYYAWMNLPRHDTKIGPHGTSWRTILETMPSLRATINSGKLCPLGLVCVQSIDPFDLGLNHQVLAWGYHDDGPATTVKLYDPNHPNDDSVTIKFDKSKPDQTTVFNDSTKDHKIFGFFTTEYSMENPAKLFYPK